MAVIAIIAQGMMGAGVGRRVHESGAEVRTLLIGRSPASAERARAAGMVAAANERELLSGADFFLSILPPGEAEPLARRLAPTLTALDRKPVYIDCNAVSPQTAISIGEVVTPTGAHFVDAGIIGGPPRQGYKGPAIYASGEHVREAVPLRDWGINLRAIDGPIGAASAVKMSYAGITKGTQALGAAMLLAAARAGSAAALHEELQFSQPEMLAWLRHFLPAMPAKAYRWIAEMQEIAGFVGDDPAARELYQGAAHFYERIAADFAADQKQVAALAAFLGRDSSSN